MNRPSFGASGLIDQVVTGQDVQMRDRAANGAYVVTTNLQLVWTARP